MDHQAEATHSDSVFTISLPKVFFLIFFLLGISGLYLWKYLYEPTKLAVPISYPMPSREPVVTPETISDWKTYANLDLKYSFNYPDSWTIVEPTTKAPLVYFVSNDSPDSNPESLNYYIYTNVITNKNKLPFKDMILSKLGNQRLKDQFEYTKEKIGLYDVYRTESLPSQRGELHAFITNDGLKYISINLNPYNSKKPYELQDKYLRLFDQILSSFEFTGPSSQYNSAYASPYDDNNILSVTTDATNLYYSANFPGGLFSRDPDEWGLINYTNDPVNLSINFVEPVSIKSIEFIFTHCPDKDYPNGYTGKTGCYYSVTADGLLNNGKSSRIIYPNYIYPTRTVDNIGPDVLDKIYYIGLIQQFTKVNIAVKRLGNDLDDYVHLKKIYITYTKSP